MSFSRVFPIVRSVKSSAKGRRKGEKNMTASPPMGGEGALLTLPLTLIPALGEDCAFRSPLRTKEPPLLDYSLVYSLSASGSYETVQYFLGGS